MAEDVRGDLLHVLRRRVGAAPEKRVGAGGGVKAERRARRGAELDERGEVAETGLRRIARGLDDVEDVVRDLVVEIHGIERGAERLDVPRRGDGPGARGLAARKPLHDPLFVRPRGERHDALEEEPVELRLRERIRALLLDRVLRGEDEKRVRERQRVVPDRHLALLHRFEERRLHLRGRAVDLVR